MRVRHVVDAGQQRAERPAEDAAQHGEQLRGEFGVEAGRRFVGHEHPRFGGERCDERRAGQLTAGELVRKAFEQVLVEVHELAELGQGACTVMTAAHLLDLPAKAPGRGERVRDVLRNVAHLRGGRTRTVRVDDDITRDDAPLDARVTRHQTAAGRHERRLASTGLTDEGRHLPRRDREADVVARERRLLAAATTHADVLEAQRSAVA